MASNENTNESERATVLQCAACGKLLATGAYVPRHDVAWCGCGSADNIPGWFEYPIDSLAGFRLFRKIAKPKPGLLGILKRFAARLSLRDAALGLAGGCLLAVTFAGAFAIGATLAPKPASPTAATSPIVCR